MSQHSDETRRQAGMRTRRAVLGDAHVDEAMANTSPFDAPFQELIVDAAWAGVWSRPQWSKRERSIVTLALLAAQGHDEELAMHLRATANTGASRDDVCEAMLHVAIYAGVPAANRAFAVAKRVFAQMETRDAVRKGEGDG